MEVKQRQLEYKNHLESRWHSKDHRNSGANTAVVEEDDSDVDSDVDSDDGRDGGSDDEDNSNDLYYRTAYTGNQEVVRVGSEDTVFDLDTRKEYRGPDDWDEPIY